MPAGRLCSAAPGRRTGGKAARAFPGLSPVRSRAGSGNRSRPAVGVPGGSAETKQAIGNSFVILTMGALRTAVYVQTPRCAFSFFGTAPPAFLHFSPQNAARRRIFALSAAERSPPAHFCTSCRRAQPYRRVSFPPQRKTPAAPHFAGRRALAVSLIPAAPAVPRPTSSSHPAHRCR